MRLGLLIVLALCYGVYGLKCRSPDSGNGEAELKKVTRSCMQRNGNQDENERLYGNQRYNYDGYYNGEQDYGPGPGQGLGQAHGQGHGQGQRQGQGRGQGQGQGQGPRQRQGQGQEREQGQGQRQQQGYDQRWQRSLKQSDMSSNNNNPNNNNNNSNNYKGNNSGEMGTCVAQCFFEELNMVDGNGQPDRRKVTYLMTKDVRDRELRNFYMDTVQQCFRYLEQSRYSHNKCGQARELIKCMSEYAKAHCDDWDEYSNLLFN